MEEKDWREYLNYILIALISIVSLTFLPMIGTTMGVEFHFPTTKWEWSLFITVRACASIVNVLIFHSFICQSKVNVKNEPKYKEAREILITTKKKARKPRSLAHFNAEEYGKKGTSLLVGTFFGTLVLTDAIINFSLVNFLTYVFTTTMAIVFGILEMKKYEEYYVTEYWEYAQMIKEENNDIDKQHAVEKSDRASSEKQG